MSSYEEVLSAALALPYDKRFELVEALDATLHPPPQYTEEELAEVLQKRLEDIHSGRAKLIDGDEAIRRIREIVDKVNPQ